MGKLTLNYKSIRFKVILYCSLNNNKKKYKMLKFAVLAALCVAAMAAGDGCHTHSECESDECCQMLMVSKRRDFGAPGNCIKLQQEGESCQKYSTCSCDSGPVCASKQLEGQQIWDFSPAVCTKVTTAAP